MSTNARRASVSSLLPILILAIILVLLIVWFNRPGPGLERDRAAHGEVLGTMTGLARPVTNALSTEYTDTNKDLIADAPTDPAKLIDPPELLFCYVASEEHAANGDKFAPLTAALAKATGKTVRFVPLTDLDEQLAAMHDGMLHITAFNTGAVPIAVDAAGFVPVSVLGGESGPFKYQLKLLASSRSGIADMKQLAGEEVTLTEMGSNSGFKAPLVLLNQKFGLMPGRDYAIRYSGGHKQSLEGLMNGTYDVVAIADDILAREEKAGTISPTAYKVLFSSDPFPPACLGHAYNLKPELAKQIESVLTSFSLSGNSMGEHLKTPDQTRLVPISYAADFQIVRDIDNLIGYEHKLRKPSPEDDPDLTTQPSTAPAAD